MLLAALGSVSLGFLTCLLFGFKLGNRGSCVITVWCVYLATIFSEIAFFQTTFFNLTYKLTINPWITLDKSLIGWSFCIDNITSSMLVVVTLISFFVHLYSTDYMALDPHLSRFMSYLSLFTLFMLFLVTANNFLIMFIGWEGVGLCSFLLINFWHTRIQANKAAIKAIFYNRIGDFFLLLAMFTIYYLFNSLDYDIIFTQVAYLSDVYLLITDTFFVKYVDLICLCLFFGAVGKSAQLGLHTWLPDAMEGPTPVSALIHAATMVTAGVFLIIRCSFLFEYSPNILLVVALVGVITAFFAATSGLFQNDIKRIIAYSTCSQLGYMVFACGLSNYQVGFFHLSNHAFFKALLFLGAGSVIHSVADEQDIRRMGGFKEVLPFAYSVFMIGSLALIGFPFLSGFYSKDIILEVAFAQYTNYSVFIFWIGLISALFTAFYSTRLLVLVFLKNTNLYKTLVISIHESNIPIFLPLLFLTFCSIFAGYLSLEFFIGFGTDFWNNVILLLPFNFYIYDIEFIKFYKLLPILAVSSGVGLAIYLLLINKSFLYELKVLTKFKILYNFLIKKWYFDRIFNEHIGQKGLLLGYSLSYVHIDRGLIEQFGPTSIATSLQKISKESNEIQSGFLYHYLNIIILFLIVIVLLVLAISFFLQKFIFLICLSILVASSTSILNFNYNSYLS
jgi:NADH-ubiquinone oxidoreductase chain 5